MPGHLDCPIYIGVVQRLGYDPQRTRSYRWSRLMIVSLTLTVFIPITSCKEQLGVHAGVRNQTGLAIDVYHTVDGREELVASLDEPISDQDLFTKAEFPTGCTTGDLVARSPEDGTEIARLTQELCINELWVIETDGSSRIRD